MKKLIISLEYPPMVGGIASYVHQFSSELSSEDVIALVPKQKGDVEFDKARDFKVVRRKLYFPPFIWPRWLRMFFQVLSIVKKEKIDIIYLHHVLPIGYVAWLVKKVKKIPFVIFSHGTDIEYATHSSWKRKMLQLVTEEAEQVVFNSESLKRRLLKVLPGLEDKSKVVYPCPEKMFYDPLTEEEISKLNSQYALEGKKVMLSVARLDEGKGLTHLIRMLPKVVEKVPNLVWFVVGDGPKKNFLVKEIQKHSLQNVVRFVGNVPHEDIKKFYYLADLFVLLTHPDEGREEGLGLVFLEAAAAGLPVVAGKSGGVEEAVIDTQTGIIVDIYKGDEIVVNSIIEMLENEEYAKRLAENAKARVKANFRWDSQLKAISKWI